MKLSHNAFVWDFVIYQSECQRSDIRKIISHPGNPLFYDDAEKQAEKLRKYFKHLQVRKFNE